MSEGAPLFPQYGEGGDRVGARRNRHAFRIGVAACILFTVALWLSDCYARHEHAEYLYITALTHDSPERARPFLRKAVTIDEVNSEIRSPKYLQALAERETAENSLLAYEEAYKLDPVNAGLAIRFGCRLYSEGDYDTARQRFVEASVNAPRNALPLYLEAAMSVFIRPGDTESLRRSLAMVARTNSSGRRTDVPKPLWSKSLPTEGYWYARLRQESAAETLAPLVEYADRVVEEARKDIQAGEIQYWDTWLKTLQQMGEQIMASALPPPGQSLESLSGGALQAVAGIRIQIAALEQRMILVKASTGMDNAAFADRLEQLEGAWLRLSEFENSRFDSRQRDEDKYRLPLNLIAGSVAVLSFLFVLSFVLSKLASFGGSAWTIRHSKFGRRWIGACNIVLFILLILVVIFQRFQADSPVWIEMFATAWWVVLTLLVAFGIVSPFVTLPSVSKSLSLLDPSTDLAEVRNRARRLHRRAVNALFRRYYGVVMGQFILVVCLWIIVHRIAAGVYPWQLVLLVTGLGEHEMQVVHQVLASLR